MESLRLPKTKVKGLYLYCPTHGKHFSSDRKTCGCPNLAYKARYHIPQHLSGGLKKCRTKIIPATNYHEAATLALEFEKSLREQDYGTQVTPEGELVQTKPIFLTECISVFMKYMRNEDVPFQFQRFRSDKHVEQIEYYLHFFNDALKKKGVNPDTLRFDRVNHLHVDYYCRYIIEVRKHGAESYNKAIKTMKRFFDYIRDEFFPYVKNPFKNIPLKLSKLENLILGEGEFNRMLETILPENGEYIKSGGRKLNV